jgi:hypothetical protein
MLFAATCLAAVSMAAPALAAPPSSQTATPTFQSGPAEGSYVASTSATFKFTSKTAQATYTCSLDGATATSCTSPLTLTNLAQGKHTLTVVAKAANKTASAPASRHWTVDTIAPKPTVAAPRGLTSPVVVAFGEAVKTATKKDVATLAYTDSGAVVPTTDTCYSGSKLVACASAAYDVMRLAPKQPLLSGQHYTATVVASTVKDLAGNANAGATLAFRGATSLQENAPGIATTWQTVKTSSAAGGSYVRERLRGATASLGFTGTGITWTTVTGPDQGKADVYIDGVRKTTVNNYAAKRHYKVARAVSGLASRAHTLRIVVLGTKGSKAGTNTFVSVDAVTVGTTTNTAPSLVTTWRRAASSHFSGGHALVADLRGEALQLSFRGTGITLVTQRGVNQGKVQVWVDGALKATYDDYAATTSYGVKRTVSGLADAVHTVRVVVLGQHHKGGKGTQVTIDRFAVS